ncbi:526_t:CDS:10 [Funneliformis mosseae]|uniref:3-oxoacyl-[acyl-carrier-protein] synthase n=1 Tax=Funneliformis mosseae TaxID=27381 RepID=A0A9N8YKW5_FUNMO|nr:526_t:CDS:10 [Funneliformis mosseae]
MSTRKVVVTGLGLVTPLATGVKLSWKKLINGESGIISLKSNQQTRIDENNLMILPYYEKEKGVFNELPSTIAGVVKPGKYENGGFDSKEWLDRGDESRMALFSQYAICAAKQALNDAEWKPTSVPERNRTGVCIGSGIGSLEDVISTTMTYNAYGPRKVSPMFVPKILINMAAGHLTMKYGFRGPNHAASTACTTGAHSIGDASRFIQFGDADVMVAGGSEACVLPLAIAGFAKAKSLVTKYNDRPEHASRPFDTDRDGFVIGEGAGMVVLEEYNHAINRGAKIYAELRGYGLSGDAHHITAPPGDGIGAELAMRRALYHAKLTPEDIDYINAHATSTILGDIAENRAIKSIFRDNKKLAISSTKGSIGHLLGAAGAVEAIFTILAIYNGKWFKDNKSFGTRQENILPPTLNLHSSGDPSEFNDFNYVPLKSQKVDGNGIRAALTNSFGFGGTNASLCFVR